VGIYLRGVDFYPAVIRRVGNMYEAQFVDLPNCRAAGRSAAETEMKAKVALETFEAMARRFCLPLPAPTEKVVQADRPDCYVAYIRSRGEKDAPNAWSVRAAA
jgi:predicted RNase H-like HicB family nuclease